MMALDQNHQCDPDDRWPESDARGIFLCYVCEKCRSHKLAGYRPEVLRDGNYQADEDIEPDDW